MSGRKSNKLRTPVTAIGRSAAVADALLKIIAVGVAGGAALIKGSQKVGEMLESNAEESKKKLEERREADKAEVRRIVDAKKVDD